MYLYAVLLAVFAVVVWIAYRWGKTAATGDAAAVAVNDARIANEAHGDVARLPDGLAVDKLRAEWSRDVRRS